LRPWTKKVVITRVTTMEVNSEATNLTMGEVAKLRTGSVPVAQRTSGQKRGHVRVEDGPEGAS
jgi:hypothetical protein